MEKLCGLNSTHSVYLYCSVLMEYPMTFISSSLHWSLLCWGSTLGRGYWLNAAVLGLKFNTTDLRFCTLWRFLLYCVELWCKEMFHITGAKLCPSVQKLTYDEFLGHRGGVFIPAISVNVGKISTSSANVSVFKALEAFVMSPWRALLWWILEWCCWKVIPGAENIRGTRVETSKLLYLDHSWCSPRDQPVVIMKWRIFKYF